MNKRKLSKTGSLLVFRKWKNKGYAAFNSLNKVVKIAVLAISYSIVINPLTGFTQQLPGDTVLSGEKLGEVVISADRLSLLAEESMRVVQVISREDIADLPVQHIAELIEAISNADVRQRGPNGVQADIGIRGGSFNQTLILLNGIKMNDPQTGHHNLNLPIELRDIIRVEILEGPGARLYGGNAFSGAINFVTEAGEKTETELTLIGGENGYFDSGLSLRHPSHKGGHFISFSRKSCNGYIDNTDFSATNLFYHGKFAGFELQTGTNSRKFGATTFYSAQYPEQYEETSSYFASVKYSGGKKIRISPAVYWRGHQDYYTLFRKTPEYYQNDHFTNVLGLDVNGRFFSEYGRTAFGLETRYESILSTALGKEFGDSIRVYGSDNRFFDKQIQRQNASFYVDHFYKTKSISISTGGLFYFSELYSNFFPGMEVLVPINKHFSLFAGLNKAFRLPTFTELYYPGLTNIGNSELKPEESFTIETGIKTKTEVVSIKTAVFYREGTNIIDWIRKPEESLWESSNITELNTFGGEIIAKIKPHSTGKKNERFKNITLSYCYLDATKTSGDYISKYALDYLKHKLGITTIIQIPFKVIASISINYQDREGGYTDFNLQEIEYSPVYVVNIKISRSIKNFDVFVEATNLFDSQYTDIGAIPLPGRWIRGGFSVNIDKK